MYKILLIVSLLLSGCGGDSWLIKNDDSIKTYEDYIKKLSEPLELTTYNTGLKLRDVISRQADEVRNINEEEDMYVYIYYTGCKFGYIVNRNDPDKMIKSWVLLRDDREDCRSRLSPP